MHARRRRGRQSEYEVQLVEKQKLQAMHGIRERQLRRTLERAHRMAGRTGENLLQLLERRLDTVVLRLGFARTIHEARQLVVHGHILVEGKRVDRPSFLVRPGHTIEVRQKDQIRVRDSILQSPEVPSYLDRDIGALKGRFVQVPRREEIPHPVDIDERLIIEFYAR
jgi:small subunit ribosomal protein S4